MNGDTLYKQILVSKDWLTTKAREQGISCMLPTLVPEACQELQLGCPPLEDLSDIVWYYVESTGYYHIYIPVCPCSLKQRGN